MFRGKSWDGPFFLRVFLDSPICILIVFLLIIINKHQVCLYAYFGLVRDVMAPRLNLAVSVAPDTR
jgi:hypothetical protein